MKDGPEIASIAALIGDPARANMLVALMGGQALTAGELAREGGVSLPTASFHISKLEAGELVVAIKQGRHRYIRLANDEVATAIEALMGVASRTGCLRSRPGPKDAELRLARICYNHLAGELGVQMLDRLITAGAVDASATPVLSETGQHRFAAIGVPVKSNDNGSSPCRTCLDWSERRPHLAGALGRDLLARFLELGWARRVPDSRVIRFTAAGRASFDAWTAHGGESRSVA
jgi:DNA-binding transcriptional ArsR family regulator